MGPIDESMFDRREALARGSVALLALGGASGLLASRASGASAVADASTALGKVGGNLDFFSWEGYDLPIGAMKRWLRKNNVKIRPTYISSWPDIPAKLKAGQSLPYDLITYGQVNYSSLAGLDLLRPIDVAKIPNLKLLHPYFQQKGTWVSNGKRWGVPFTFGATACNYRPDRTSRPTSWFDLLKPEYKGKVGWGAGLFGSFVLVGRILGLKPPNFTKAQFERVKTFMNQMKAQSTGVGIPFGDITNQLVSGDIVIVFSGWSAVDGFAAAKGTTVRSVIPKEGSWTFADAFAIPKSADNVDSAHAFINASLGALAQAQGAAYLAGGAVNLKALKFMSAATRGLYPYSNLSSLFKAAPAYPGPPVTAKGDVIPLSGWQEAWAQLQA